jgi:PAS domain S-box-containing protein
MSMRRINRVSRTVEATVTKNISKRKHVDDLRRRAEQIIPEKMESPGEMSAPEIQKLIHELNVHQIELEMQNEALRKSQMETAESLYKYSDLYDFAPVGYFTFDKKGHIIETNVTGASLLGTEKRALAKQPFQRFIVPGHFSIFQSHLQKAHELPSKQICKLRLTGKDGTPFDALIGTIAVKDDKGEFDHYRSSVTDITEITRAEAALWDAEERFRVLVETTRDIVYAADRKGFLIYVNPMLERVLGYTHHELEGKPFAQIVAPECINSVKDRFKRAIKGEAVPVYEADLIGKDETRLSVEFNVVTIYDHDGNPSGRYGIGRDITERKQAAELLQRSEENFRRSLDDSPMGVRIVTEEGETIYANRAILDIYGYDSIEELKTTPLKKRYTPESYAGFQIRREKREKGDYEPSEYEISIVRKDGEIRHLHVFRKKVLWDGERQFQVLYNDITKRKQAEEEIKASYQQLRALAGRLQSSREEQRKEIAREIHDEMGGALTALKIDLSSLARSAPKSSHKTKRDSFLSKMIGMTKLIDETIGTVRRIVTELRPSILDDFGLIAALEWQLQEFQKRTGIQSEFVSTKEDINLDEELSTAVFRIFQESITNVARHANATKVTATLYKEADSLVLKVEDNGKGISEDDIHNAKSVGLVGMRERAFFLGGTVNISGEPSKGTTVSVQFPFSS